MAGGPVHDLAQRQHHTAESADCGPLRVGALLGDLRWHGRDRWPRWGGAVSGWERPCGGRSRIRVGRGWLGHDVFPLGGGDRRSALGDRWLSSRPERCDGEWAGARALAGASLRTIVLEARDRIGGRILTHRDPRVPVSIELGAEFIHGSAPETSAIVPA